MGRTSLELSYAPLCAFKRRLSLVDDAPVLGDLALVARRELRRQVFVGVARGLFELHVQIVLEMQSTAEPVDPLHPPNERRGVEEDSVERGEGLAAELDAGVGEHELRRHRHRSAEVRLDGDGVWRGLRMRDVSAALAHEDENQREDEEGPRRGGSELGGAQRHGVSFRCEILSAYAFAAEMSVDASAPSWRRRSSSARSFAAASSSAVCLAAASWSARPPRATSRARRSAVSTRFARSGPVGPAMGVSAGLRVRRTAMNRIAPAERKATNVRQCFWRKALARM